MQVVEQVIGTFLLQETRPVALLGAVTAISTGTDKGWILASLSLSNERFECVTASDTVTVKMSFEAAIRFASVLLILVSQHRTELYEDMKAASGQLDVAGAAGDKVITWTSPPASPHVKFAVVDDGIELRLRPELAMALAFAMIRKLGKLAA